MNTASTAAIYVPSLGQWVAVSGSQLLAVSATREGLEKQLGESIPETAFEVFGADPDLPVDPSELLSVYPGDLPWLAEA